jgi:hypothetical protein
LIAFQQHAKEGRESMCPTKPWLKFYGDVPHSLDYPQMTMYEALMLTVFRSPEAIAYDFLGCVSTYEAFGTAIDRCADGLAGLGLKKERFESVISKRGGCCQLREG